MDKNASLVNKRRAIAHTHTHVNGIGCAMCHTRKSQNKNFKNY